MLKISGEAIAGDNTGGKGIDPKFAKWLANEIKKVTATGVQLGIIIGGGNIVRGSEIAGDGLETATGHYMGMMAGVINGLALRDLIESTGQSVRLMSTINVDRFAEQFVRRKAIDHMENGRVVLFVGGTSRPFVTHDTVAVGLGLEIDCDEVYKASQVDGVYDKDPNKFKDAKKYESLDYQTVMSNPEIKVMDKAALGLAAEQGMPVTVFELHKDDNILRAISGENIGTRVS